MAKYKRRIYVVDSKFQIKFSLYVCIAVLLSGLIYPITMYDVLTHVAQKLSSESLTHNINNVKNNLLTVMVLWHLGFSLLIFIICIFFSHKIAGPLFKLKKHLRSLRDGVETGPLRFRKGDYFQDLAEDVNETIGKINEQYNKDLMYLSEVNSYLNNLSFVVPDDKKAVLQEIHTKLDEIQNRFKP